MDCKRVGLASQYEFCGSKYVLKRVHACGSCNLEDWERDKWGGYNQAIDDAAKIMEEMEREILSLRSQLAEVEGGDE